LIGNAVVQSNANSVCYTQNLSDIFSDGKHGMHLLSDTMVL